LLHLVSVDTSEEADEISQRFHASGVPVFVEPDLTRTDPSVRSAAFGHRIHIWLEEQLDDAKRLLRDPQYEVVAPLMSQSSMAPWISMTLEAKGLGTGLKRSGSIGWRASAPLA